MTWPSFIHGSRLHYSLLNITLLLIVSCRCWAVTTDLSRQQELEAPAAQQTMLRLARQAMKHYLETGKTLAVPSDLPPVLKRRAAVFVTVEKRGQVMPRGCRGTLQPAYQSLAEEIIHNSVAAVTRDRRVPPLRLAELPHCLISLTVVLRVEPLASIAQHDADLNGLIAKSGDAIGIVLPFEGHDSQLQLQWAKRKAGLPNNAKVQLAELIAVRFREAAPTPKAAPPASK